MPLDKMEQQANILIEQGQIDTAVKHIYDLIVAWGNKKNFSKANAWRNKLIEINPMAMTEIIESSEIIESAKANAIDYNHKKIWEHLYYSLTQDEGNSLYLKLNEREFPPGKILIQQGKLNNTLFFVDSGQLKTIFSQGGKANFINALEQGDTAGQDTFFNISNCTSTVITVSPTKIRFLERAALLDLENEFQGFTKKLESFCLRQEVKNTETILKEKALERRQNHRYKLAGKISAQIYDKKNNSVGPPLYGWLGDVSVGGASFFIECSSQYVGRTLLGRLTTLSIQFENGPQMEFYGQILGARFDLVNTYTIHLKFTKSFDEEKLNEIAAICK